MEKKTELDRLAALLNTNRTALLGRSRVAYLSRRRRVIAIYYHNRGRSVYYIRRVLGLSYSTIYLLIKNQAKIMSDELYPLLTKSIKLK